jgi:hypothetical protein
LGAVARRIRRPAIIRGGRSVAAPTTNYKVLHGGRPFSLGIALERILPKGVRRAPAAQRRVSGSLGLAAFTSEEGSGEMAFRLSVNQAPDLTTIGVAGRLDGDAVVILGEACGGARRPLVLDLSDLTNASNAGVLLLRRLASEGVHLLGASRYVRLLLEDAPDSGVPTSRWPAPPPLQASGRRRRRRS